MSEVLYEILGELIVVLVSAIGSLVFTIGGFVIEQAGIQNIVSGSVTVGVWEAYMGGVLLFVGVYLFGYRQCWCRIRQYSTRMTTSH